MAGGESLGLGPAPEQDLEVRVAEPVELLGEAEAGRQVAGSVQLFGADTRLP